ADPQPVFDLICRRAAELCNTPHAVLFEYDGELLHWRAKRYDKLFGAPEAQEALERRYPMRPTHPSLIGRAILERQLIHIRDSHADPELYQTYRNIGIRSVLDVPLLRDGVPIGVLGLGIEQPGGFSDTQVALLQTFAEQAVIAISSAE